MYFGINLLGRPIIEFVVEKQIKDEPKNPIGFGKSKDIK